MSHIVTFLGVIMTFARLLCLVAIIAPVNSYAIQLTDAENSVLEEIRDLTVSAVNRQMVESQKLAECFEKSIKCESEIRVRLSSLRQTIIHANEEYRLLTALSQKSFFNETPYYASPSNSQFRLSRALPSIQVNLRAAENPQSEISVLRKIGTGDYLGMKAESRSFYSHHTPNIRFDPSAYRLKEHFYQASKFYKAQSILVIQGVPFVIFIKTDQPSDKEIAEALRNYTRRLQDVIKDLNDEKVTPLEAYLAFEPVVERITRNSPQKRDLVRQMLEKNKHQVGFRAWVERNSPSLKVAAFTTCALVGSIIQAWPLTLSCGGALVAITGNQVYVDYIRMQDNLGLWLSGAQSYSAFKTAEARLVYSALALLFAGQGVYSTIAKIETGLITTLANMPQQALARVSSLTALREGGVRFAALQGRVKSKDLGASIFAEDLSQDINMENIQSRFYRIFKYSDLLNLKDSIMATEI